MLSICETEVPCDLKIFAGLPCDQIRLLMHGAVVKKHHSGERLFRMGESADFFGYVLAGAYKLSLTDPDGDEVIMHFGVRGEALGIMSTMESEFNFPFDAIAMGEARFLKIPKINFTKFWVQNPTVMMRYQNDLQGRIFKSHDEKRLQRRPLAERIADLLVYLSDHKSKNSQVIEIPITRREIAAYIGATVESVIRTMSPWNRAGIFESSDRHIVIHSRSRLLEICGSSNAASPTEESEASYLSTLWRKTGVSAKCASKSGRSPNPAYITPMPDCPVRRQAHRTLVGA